MDQDLPVWQCPRFDDLIAQAFDMLPLDTAQWYTGVVLKYREALRAPAKQEGDGSDARDKEVLQRMTMQDWHRLLVSFFMLLPVPNFHTFSFQIMLESPEWLASSESDAGEDHVAWRAATLCCALAAKKRECMTGTLPDEVIAGFKQTSRPYMEIFGTRRTLCEDGKERITSKSDAVLSDENNDQLDLVISCRGKLYSLTVPASAPPAAVSAALRQVLSSETTAPAAPAAGGFCELTYVLRPELMTALGGDAAWRAVWDRVQDADLVLSLLADTRATELCRSDPVYGAMAHVHKLPAGGGIVGDKHTLCVFGDGHASFVWDHALMDGAPGAYIASQVEMTARTHGEPARAPAGDGGATLQLQPLAVPAEGEWTDGVRAAVASGVGICKERVESDAAATSHVRVSAFGRRAAKEKGLSVDGLFQAALQLTLAMINDPELMNVAEVVSTRHYRYGRSTNMVGDSDLMSAFVRECMQAFDLRPSPSGEGDDSGDTPSEEQLAKLAVLLKAAVTKHKHRIKVSKRSPLIFANFMLALGEAAAGKTPQQVSSSTADAGGEGDGDACEGFVRSNSEFEVLADRCIQLFGALAATETSEAARALMMSSVVVSNSPDWPGVALFATTPSSPVTIGYIMREAEIDFFFVCRCADKRVKLHGKDVPLLDAFSHYLNASLHHVATILEAL